jgi:oxygen-independent coproporphyrinogen-3 oxidase
VNVPTWGVGAAAKDADAIRTTVAAATSSPAARGDNGRVYVHYPYCPKKCGYCAFPSTVSRALESRYCTALLKEIKSSTKEGPIVSVFFGGGSPGLAPLSLLGEIISELRPSFSDQAEVTIELRPEEFSSELLQQLISVGVTRISFGVQSFVAEKRRALGRGSFDSALLAAKGVSRSIDLLIGTAFDDAVLDDELAAIARLRPEHVSVYPLTLERGSRYSQKSPLFLAPERISHHYDRVCEFLQLAGYVHYAYSNFAHRDAAPCTHNLGYWLNDDFRGFGVSAHTKRGPTFIERSFKIEKYIDAIDNDWPVPARVSTLTQQEYAEETLLMRLRLLTGTPLDGILCRAQNKHALLSMITKLENSGYVSVRSGLVTVHSHLNFDRCIQSVGWTTTASHGWRRIIPERLKSGSLGQ